MTDEMFQTAIANLAQGDKDSLKLIYQAYVRLIYAVIYDVMGRKEDAEDVTSEFFIKLVRVAKSFIPGSPHKAWLVKIARNMAIDYIRKNRREVLLAATGDDKTDDNVENSIENIGADGKECRIEDGTIFAEDMKKAMQCLKPKEKEIIDMKLIGQLTFKEIAEIRGTPIGTVTWLYNQGIKKLRRCLIEYEQDR